MTTNHPTNEAAAQMIAAIAEIPPGFLKTPEAIAYLADMGDAMQSLEGVETDATSPVVAFDPTPESAK